MHASTVDPRRITALNHAPGGPGPVLHWMHRDQRTADNFGLLHARDLAARAGVPLAVCFCLVPAYLGAQPRHYAFMLAGLRRVEADLAGLGIPFFLLKGDPAREVTAFAARLKPLAVTTDLDPLRLKQSWMQSVAKALDAPLVEVDSRNLVPARLASGIKEFAARTIRPKIGKLLPEFFHEPPALGPQPVPWPHDAPANDWPQASGLFENAPAPGEAAALAHLDDFVRRRLTRYAQDKNDPNKDAVSGLSPYLHFGQLSPLRAALAADKSTANRESTESFLEELVVRRELAENFCLHEPDYDNPKSFPDWAKATLDAHRADPREYLYDLPAFEKAATHDPLWNAAQNQMLRTGSVHGYMRMYWAKKILEWTPSPEQAMAVALALNDQHQLDGRDPNGYAGIAWSIGGVHDRPFKERPVFGKVRYMNDKGAARKFDVKAYVRRWGGETWVGAR